MLLSVLVIPVRFILLNDPVRAKVSVADVPTTIPDVPDVATENVLAAVAPAVDPNVKVLVPVAPV